MYATTVNCRHRWMLYEMIPEAKLAFERLKEAVARAPALNFPDYSRDFAVAVDSSIRLAVSCFSPEPQESYPQLKI